MTGTDLLVAGAALVPLVGCALLARRVLRRRDRGRLTDDLKRTEEDFRSLVELSSDGVAIVDDELRLLFASPAARVLLGLPDPGAAPGATGGARGEIPAVHLPDLVAPDHRARMRAALSTGSSLFFTIHAPEGTDDQPARELEATHHARPGSGRRMLQLRDVTTRRRRERELERMAYTDHLTRLPNRAMLFQEMATLAGAAGERCLLVIDLDGFKAVNDVAGHEAGDQLLIEMGRRLRTVVREEDLVARLGGDEFAVLVSGSMAEATEIAQRVVDALATPHHSGEWTFAVGGSVGLTRLRPGGGQLAFREADAALRAAKQAGKGCLRIASGALAARIVAGPDLATAIAEGAVQLRYDLALSAGGRAGRVHAVPVWAHPEHGTVPATELWAAAERQGLSAGLQQWLLRQACAEVAELTDRRGRPLELAVDLPAGHVWPDDLVGEVSAALVAAAMPPSRLTLYFTEETLLTSAAELVPALHVVHEAGVRLCLDDYGMGRTLYAHLARVPLDAVRVDLAALAARGDTARALHVLGVIRATAHAFGLLTVADGIDTPSALAGARRAGVELVQGRAVPGGLTRAQVADLLRRETLVLTRH